VYDDYPEEAAEATGQELMEIDGKLVAFLQFKQS
jgi:U5 small nuclear ribonucleoprotein component